MKLCFVLLVAASIAQASGLLECGRFVSGNRAHNLKQVKIRLIIALLKKHEYESYCSAPFPWSIPVPDQLVSFQDVLNVPEGKRVAGLTHLGEVVEMERGVYLILNRMEASTLDWFQTLEENQPDEIDEAVAKETLTLLIRVQHGLIHLDKISLAKLDHPGHFAGRQERLLEWFNATKTAVESLIIASYRGDQRQLRRLFKDARTTPQDFEDFED